MCFGIRKSTPFHLATLILPIQNQKYPKNVKNACKFILFSHHQFNIRVCYVHAVLLHVKYYYAILLHVKYATMFILWTVVFHFHLFGQFSTDSERNQFSRYPPFAPITLCALPSKDSAHLLFNSNEFFFLTNLTFCSPEKWLVYRKPGHLLIQALLQLEHGLRTGGEEAGLENSPNSK